MTVAELIVSRLKQAGTRTIFGVPGGGSNLDVIDAARRAGLPFVLAQTETGGAIMATAQAEVSGAPGACLCTLGPGVSSIVNGIAHAHLDRVPLIVMTDAMEDGARQEFEHQRLPHGALLAPLTRWTAALTADRAATIVDLAVARACGSPPGPVQVDCTTSAMSAQVTGSGDAHRAGEAGRRLHSQAQLSERGRRLLENARRPVVIAGMDARDAGTAASLRTYCGQAGLPVLMTYKAKGVVPDDHPWYAGLFTLGAIERPLVERADLVITVGLDAVELLPRSWPYAAPIVHCARRPPSRQLPAGETLIGEIARSSAAAVDCLRDSEWTADEIAACRERQREAVLARGEGMAPGEAIAVVAEATRGTRHVTVDAGAHMFPAMVLLPAEHPGRILISNGLSTMGFALPAAIGAALLTPGEPVVALTGDAGLLMCLGELRTAARAGLRVILIVMADDELSLIRIKQDRRGLAPEGVRLGGTDWPLLARAVGWRGSRASDAASLHQQVAQAMRAEGSSLIEARIDPSPYGAMLHAIRG